MSIEAYIKDSGGSGRAARVTEEFGLRVGIYPADLEPTGTPNRYRFYTALLGSTGADSGTTNMNVDGSSTAQEFYIAAHADYDLRIMAIVILIADTAVAHNTFGAVAALATGWDLKVQEAGEDTLLIEKAKTGGQVIAYTGGFGGYGNDAVTWQLSDWTGTTDAQLVTLPVYQLVPGGFRIGRGTKDKIVSVVNDDLTGLTQFLVRLMGYRHYPK